MQNMTFYAVLIVLAAPCNAQTAQELSKLARQYEQEGKLDLAVAHAEKAAQADPKNWRLAWDLGEMLLYKTTDREKALTVFTDALNRGYTHPIVYHKQAMCHFHLGHYAEAIDLLNRSIAENKELLRKAEKAKDKGTADHARYQIGDSYDWLTKQYKAVEDYPHFYEAAKQVEAYYPASQWLPNLLHDGISRVSYEEIARGDLQNALTLCREEEEIVKRYKKEPDWRVPRYTLSEVLEKRIKLGNIKPAYTHKIQAVYFNYLKTSFTLQGQQKVIDRKMTDREKRTAIVYQKVLTMMIESISDGQLSLSWDSVEVNEPIRELKVIDNEDPSAEPVWANIQEFSQLFRNGNDNYDTYFLIWNGPTLEAVGGATRFFNDKPIKGVVRIQPEHTVGIWLHEFFHVVESKVGISPTHGYYKESRGSFPDWKGPTDNQLDYFRWHFDTTVRKFGFENFKFE